jgi:uncharacterized membrane-anchored protein YjiN (DUF445 family)
MSSTVVRHPPIPQLSPADEIQVRRALRRNRLLATGLLALTIVIAAATRLEPSPGWLVQLVRAGAEAGIVGGLADWFAITVLFRHPFGIPIPHTAILPSNKDRIGRSLGSFIERNFLVPEVILPKLRQVDLAGKIAAWLTLPDTAPRVADWIITLLKRLLAASDSAQINELIQRTIGQQLRGLDLAPLLARVIDVFTTSEESDVLFEKVTQAAKNWIAANRAKIDEMVGQHSRWWIPKTIDRRIAAQTVDGTIDLLHHLQQRDSDVRKQFQAALTSLISDLITSAEQRDKIQHLKTLLFDDAEVRTWIACTWDKLSQRLVEELSDPRSNARATLHSAILALAHSMQGDAFIRSLIDSIIERIVTQLIQWRGEIGSLIAEVVRNWDARTVSERLELILGSDLQYIRINGTIVGALVGCGIYLLSIGVEAHCGIISYGCGNWLR